MSDFVHFCFNYPHDFLDVAFKDERMLQHLKDKFSSIYNRHGSRATIPTFFSELDSENQEILSNYVTSLYTKNKHP